MVIKYIGNVRAVLPYGAFIELEPGISGLLHISDLSWSDHIKHPKEMLNEGDSIEVIILGFDSEKQHIALGYKQLTEDPWSTIDARYLTGTKITGELTTKTKFGLFIKLEEGSRRTRPSYRPQQEFGNWQRSVS